MKKILSVLVFSLLLTACSTSVRTPGTYDDFARCLTGKGIKMYGADTCPHCKEQKRRFEGSFDLVTYIECIKDPQACQDAKIEGYPTWMIDGKPSAGTKSLSELSEMTKCPLSGK